MLFQPYIISYNNIESKISIYIYIGKGKIAIFVIRRVEWYLNPTAATITMLKHVKTTLPTTNMPATTPTNPT